MTRVVKKIPPDGGYAWIIMCALTINYFVLIPMLQLFSLVYKDTFKELKFTATEISFIINTCAAFYMLIGIVNGPLLKHFGYRKVAVMGAIFTTTGVLLTSRATQFQHFMVSHGLVTAAGVGIAIPASSLALNTYFVKKRAKATGLGMALSGFGPVLMPQLMSFLLFAYGVKGAMLILSGIVSHAFVSAALLQPVKWHMKDENAEQETLMLEGKRNKKEEKQRKISVSSSRRASMEQSLEEQLKHDQQHLNIEKESLLKRIGQNIVQMFDLTLLKDPVFLNIAFGMALVVFGELTFSVLVPFILGDYNLTIPQIATFMSMAAISDITFRFCVPFIGDFLKQPPRVMYLVALTLLITAKFSLLLTDDFRSLLAVAAALGCAKGFRIVYNSLTLPSYVPIERLGAASGIQMTVTGVFVLIGGPAIGYIRDVSGSYSNCICVLNGFTFVTFVMWTAEMLYVKYKTKKKNSINDVTLHDVT